MIVISIKLSQCPLSAKELGLFIKGARIKTLPAGLIPVFLANALAFHQTGRLSFWLLFLTAVSALFIQMAVNFFNDAYDFKGGADGPARKGPKRLTAEGQKSFLEMRAWGLASCLIACLFGAPLVVRGGWRILIIGLAGCFMAWAYTAGRRSLLNKGLSELVCFLFFGPLAVLGSYWLQTLSFNTSLIYLGAQCGFQAVSLLLINHLRDEEEDRRARRRHFVTLYGRSFALLFLVIAQAFVYLLCFYWMGFAGAEKAGALSFFVLPFSFILIYKLCVTPASSAYNRYLALCSLFYMMFGGAFIAGLFLP